MGNGVCIAIDRVADRWSSQACRSTSAASKRRGGSPARRSICELPAERVRLSVSIAFLAIVVFVMMSSAMLQLGFEFCVFGPQLIDHIIPLGHLPQTRAHIVLVIRIGIAEIADGISVGVTLVRIRIPRAVVQSIGPFVTVDVVGVVASVSNAICIAILLIGIDTVGQLSLMSGIPSPSLSGAGPASMATTFPLLVSLAIYRTPSLSARWPLAA